MSAFVQAVLVYTMTVQAPQTLAMLNAELTAVVLDTSILDELGATLTSDVTTNASATTVARTITISFVARSSVYPIIASTTPFRGAIVSSSPNDKVGGTGLQRVRINYVDSTGNKNYEEADMNGTTPVRLTASNKVTITGFQPLLGSASGMVTVNNTAIVNGVTSGDRIGQILNNWTGSVLSTNEFDSPMEGVVTATVTYLDAGGGGPHTETIPLQGQRPVNFVNTNKGTILTIVTNLLNFGTIMVYTGPNATGAPAATLNPSFASNFPSGTDQAAPFRDLFTHQLTQGVGSKLVASEPVLS